MFVKRNKFYVNFQVISVKAMAQPVAEVEKMPAVGKYKKTCVGECLELFHFNVAFCLSIEIIGAQILILS